MFILVEAILVLSSIRYKLYLIIYLKVLSITDLLEKQNTPTIARLYALRLFSGTFKEGSHALLGEANTI